MYDEQPQSFSIKDLQASYGCSNWPRLTVAAFYVNGEWARWQSELAFLAAALLEGQGLLGPPKAVKIRCSQDVLWSAIRERPI